MVTKMSSRSGVRCLMGKRFKHFKASKQYSEIAYPKTKQGVVFIVSNVSDVEYISSQSFSFQS